MQVLSESLTPEIYRPRGASFVEKLILTGGVVALLLSLAPAALFAINTSATTALAISILLAGAGSASIVISRRRAKLEAARKVSYGIITDGLLRESAAGLELFRWNDIARVYYDDSPPARAIPAQQVIRLITQMGDIITIDQETEGHYALGEKVAQHVARHILPVAMHNIRLGQEVAFGEVRLSAKGFRYKDQFIGWAETSATTCNYNHAARANLFEVVATGEERVRTRCRVPLSEIPNSALFRTMLATLNPPRGVRRDVLTR